MDLRAARAWVGGFGRRIRGGEGRGRGSAESADCVRRIRV